MDWIGLARSGTDWQEMARIGKFENFCWNQGLAPDWHWIGTGLAMDWHGLARIGKLDNMCHNEKLVFDWHQIAQLGSDLH